MKTLGIAVLLMASSMIVAQAPPAQPNPVQTVPVETVPPTKTELLALSAVREELSKAIGDVNEVAQDIAKNHPGYHLNVNTAQIEKDAPKETPKVPEKVEPKK